MSKLLVVLDKLPVVAFTLFVPTMFFWTFPDMGFVVSLAISMLWWVLEGRYAIERENSFAGEPANLDVIVHVR